MACKWEVAGEFREQAYQEAAVQLLHYQVSREQAHLALQVCQEQALQVCQE